MQISSDSDRAANSILVLFVNLHACSSIDDTLMEKNVFTRSSGPGFVLLTSITLHLHSGKLSKNVILGF